MIDEASYPSRRSLDRAAELARLPRDSSMQDWPIEVADPERLGEFLSLLRAHENDWELTYSFLDLVLESARERKDLDAWVSRLVAALLSAYRATRAPALKKRVEYWACEDSPLEDAFEVAPVARRVLDEIRRSA